MIFDVLVALVIAALAVVSVVGVHPMLLFILVLAAVYFISRHMTKRGVGDGYYQRSRL